MASIYRSVVLGLGALAMLSACGISSYGTASGSNPTTTGTTGTTPPPATGGLPGGGETGVMGSHDTIVATPSTSMVSVVVGSTVTQPITFTSSDGRAITGFALSLGTALPAGWTGPNAFGCATVSTGNGCLLNLMYAPTTYAAPAVITLKYVYVDNSGEPVTSGMATINYQATTDDNMVATAAPAGQISATIGSATPQTVNITFTTDDMEPASALALTSSVPTPLPAGWTGPATTTCATVSAGTACTMAWTYMPTAPANGTIMINYAYDNDSGTAKTGSFNIPYAATADDGIVGSVSPATTPINVLATNSQPVTVTFTTTDGFVASNLLVTSDLTALPAGWTSSSANFTCAAISTGTTCQLSLTYAPAAAGDNNTLQITYTYNNNAGTAMQGTVNIPYTSS